MLNLTDIHWKLRFSIRSGPYTKTQLSDQCLLEVLTNMMCHPVYFMCWLYFHHGSADLDFRQRSRVREWIIVRLSDGERNNEGEARSQCNVVLPQRFDATVHIANPQQWGALGCEKFQPDLLSKTGLSFSSISVLTHYTYSLVKYLDKLCCRMLGDRLKSGHRKNLAAIRVTSGCC